MFNLKGRVAVVTGASSGLGLQMAHGFANQGADLVIMARRIQRLRKLQRYQGKIWRQVPAYTMRCYRYRSS